MKKNSKTTNAEVLAKWDAVTSAPGFDADAFEQEMFPNAKQSLLSFSVDADALAKVISIGKNAHLDTEQVAASAFYLGLKQMLPLAA
jgi:hypothetical protein